MLQFFETLHIRRVEAPELGFPLVVGGRADAVMPPDLIDRTTGIGLFRVETICVSVNFD